MANKENYWSGFDYFKYILSILVIIIHTEPFGHWIYPLLSIAVPMFFVISSYFFFRSCKGDETDKMKLKKFVKRNLILYAFWFIALLPITLDMRNYFEGGLTTGMLKMLKGFLFGSTFKVSWFIMATIVGVTLFYNLRKYLKPHIMVVLCIIAYMVCCATSSYYHAFALSNAAFVQMDVIYRSVLGEPHHSFPVAFFWVSVGWLFANSKVPKMGGGEILYLVHRVIRVVDYRASLYCRRIILGTFIHMLCLSAFGCFLTYGICPKNARKQCLPSLFVGNKTAKNEHNQLLQSCKLCLCISKILFS